VHCPSLYAVLQPSNVLIMGDGEEQGVVKIADFGLARIFHSPLRPLSENGVVVTIWYRCDSVMLQATGHTKKEVSMHKMSMLF
jgi:cyclin-dependent kinase 8/11